jgi:hypothetical protein
MSSDLHQTTVQWDGRNKRGLVKVDGVTVDLAKCSEPPRFLRAFLGVWYNPGVRQFEIQEDCVHPRREMRPEEIKGVERFLLVLRDTINRCMTG